MEPEVLFPAELQRSFDRQIKLCDDLEAVADSLPSRTDRQFCLHLARQIGPVLRDAHAVEERYLFPTILIGHRGSSLIERLRWEHMVDESYGEEVQEELLQLGQGAPAMTAEAIGYMLRGFFEGMRRHVFHEIELLRSTETRH